jgi:hypothetical protein
VASARKLVRRPGRGKMSSRAVRHNETDGGMEGGGNCGGYGDRVLTAKSQPEETTRQGPSARMLGRRSC